MASAVRQGEWATVVLTGISAGWGLVLIVLAFVLPFVTPATVSPEPPLTLVQYSGPGVLLFVVLPALVSLVVGLLLWPRGVPRSSVATVVAWVLAIGLLVAALVGTVTILIGLAVVPSGVLLVVACARTIEPKIGVTG